MRYLIDGYNVTKRDPATRDLPLEEQRDTLERRLRVAARDVLGAGSYTIVWDASHGAGSTHRLDAPVGFTRMPTADDAIVSKVRSAKERIGVVTSDRELANRCRSAASCGVDVLPAERLFAESAKRSGGAKGGKRAPIPRDVGLPANAHAITRELKELWGSED